MQFVHLRYNKDIMQISSLKINSRRQLKIEKESKQLSINY